MCKRFKKVAAGAVSALTAVSLISVNAGAACMQTGDYSVRLYGKLTDAMSDNTVNVQIFMPGKTVEDLYRADKEDFKSIVAYQNEIECDENGEYSITVETEGVSGVYNAFLYYDGKLRKESFVYSNPAASKEALERLNAAATYDEVRDIIEKRQYDLGFYSELFEEAEKEDTVRFIFNRLKKKKFDTDDRAAAVTVFNKAVISQAMKNKRISDVFAYADEISLDTGDISEFYNASFVTASLRRAVTENLYGKTLADDEEFDSAINEAFVLGVVEKPNGYKNIRPVILKFADDIGIYSVSDSVCSRLAGEKYGSYGELKAAIEKIEKSASAGGSSGGGGSSSGGTIAPNVSTVEVVGALGTANAAEDKSAGAFSDLADAEWAAEYINALAKEGIVNGKNDNRFCPNDNITREEFVKMIVNAFEIKSERRAMADFSDVKEDMWYFEFIKRAYTAEVINGYGDSRFGIGDFITRQDVAVIAYNAAFNSGKIGFGNSKDFEFDDDEEISDYAHDAVYALRKVNVIDGMTETEFVPNGLATRAQSAKIVCLLRAL